jgi:hypothetical protein
MGSGAQLTEFSKGAPPLGALLPIGAERGRIGGGDRDVPSPYVAYLIGRMLHRAPHDLLLRRELEWQTHLLRCAGAGLERPTYV